MENERSREKVLSKNRSLSKVQNKNDLKGHRGYVLDVL